MWETGSGTAIRVDDSDRPGSPQPELRRLGLGGPQSRHGRPGHLGTTRPVCVSVRGPAEPGSSRAVAVATGRPPGTTSPVDPASLSASPLGSRADGHAQMGAGELLPPAASATRSGGGPEALTWGRRPLRPRRTAHPDGTTYRRLPPYRSGPGCRATRVSKPPLSRTRGKPGCDNLCRDGRRLRPLRPDTFSIWPTRGRRPSAAQGAKPAGPGGWADGICTDGRSAAGPEAAG